MFSREDRRARAVQARAPVRDGSRRRRGSAPRGDGAGFGRDGGAVPDGGDPPPRANPIGGFRRTRARGGFVSGHGRAPGAPRRVPGVPAERLASARAARPRFGRGAPGGGARAADGRGRGGRGGASARPRRARAVGRGAPPPAHRRAGPERAPAEGAVLRDVLPRRRAAARDGDALAAHRQVPAQRRPRVAFFGTEGARGRRLRRVDVAVLPRREARVPVPRAGRAAAERRPARVRHLSARPGGGLPAQARARAPERARRRPSQPGGFHRERVRRERRQRRVAFEPRGRRRERIGRAVGRGSGRGGRRRRRRPARHRAGPRDHPARGGGGGTRRGFPRAPPRVTPRRRRHARGVAGTHRQGPLQAAPRQPRARARRAPALLHADPEATTDPGEPFETERVRRGAGVAGRGRAVGRRRARPGRRGRPPGRVGFRALQNRRRPRVRRRRGGTRLRHFFSRRRGFSVFLVLFPRVGRRRAREGSRGGGPASGDARAARRGGVVERRGSRRRRDSARRVRRERGRRALVPRRHRASRRPPPGRARVRAGFARAVGGRGAAVAVTRGVVPSRRGVRARPRRAARAAGPGIVRRAPRRDVLRGGRRRGRERDARFGRFRRILARRVLRVRESRGAVLVRVLLAVETPPSRRRGIRRPRRLRALRAGGGGPRMPVARHPRGDDVARGGRARSGPVPARRVGRGGVSAHAPPASVRARGASVFDDGARVAAGRSHRRRRAHPRGGRAATRGRAVPRGRVPARRRDRRVLVRFIARRE